MKERVKNLSTPARRPTAACDVMDSAGAPHVTFAPGVGGTPALGARAAQPHTPAAPGSSLGVPGAAHKTPAPSSLSARRTPGVPSTHYAKTPGANSSSSGGSGDGNPPAQVWQRGTPRARAPAAHSTPHHSRAADDSTLAEYLRAAGVTPPHVRGERERLVAALRANPCASTWCEFLEFEEAALGDETSHAAGADGTYAAGRNGVSLFRLFEHATRALAQVSRAASHETQGYYLRLYLGLARQQMASNMDDARDTFKYLKSEGFWQKHAMFWSEWAAFGHQYKGAEKALKILNKGIESGEVAEGLGVLHDMKASIEGGVFGGGARKGGRGTDAREGKEGAPLSAAPTPRLRAAGGDVARTSTIPPFAGAAADDATVPVPSTATRPANDENAPPRSRGGAPLARDAADDVTMEICAPGREARETEKRAEAPRGPGAISAERLAPTRMEEDATVAVPAPGAFARQQSAPAAMAAAGRQHATAPASSTAAARAAAHAAAHAASAAASAAEDAAARKAEEKKKRPKIRENSEMVIVRGVKYLKLECVGQGGTCKVYKVLCPKRKTYALKRIKLAGREKETVAGFMDEIRLLQGLRGRDNIIQLVDAEVCKSEGLIYVVLEYGEIDLARLLSKREKQAKARSKSLASAAAGGGSSGGGSSGMIDDNFLRLYFEQMVEAVGTIHEQKIVHSDLKPANFLFVEGALKLIDFGIAKQDTSKSDTTNIVRDHQVGTVNYMSPEAILNGQPSALGGPLKVGRASDIWSLGCILYQMVYGQTPFARINGMIPKLHAITDPKHEIPMPPVANPHLVELVRACLARHPHRRITIDGILKHPFLRPAAAEVAATPGRGGAGAEPASPAPASGLSASQLTNLLEQIQKHGADVDVGAVTQEVFRQIAAGASEVSVSPLLRKHAKKKENGGEGHAAANAVREPADASAARDGSASSGLTQDIGGLAMSSR